jgi:hypothetical protein
MSQTTPSPYPEPGPPRPVLPRLVGVIVVSSAIGLAINSTMKFFIPVWTSKAMVVVREQAMGGTGNASLLELEAATGAALASNDEVLQRALERPEVQATDFAAQFVSEDGVFNASEALIRLRSGLQAEPLPGTRLFRVQFSTRVPKDAPTILNAVINGLCRLQQVSAQAEFDRQREHLHRSCDMLDHAIAEDAERTRDLVRAGGLPSADPDVNEVPALLEQASQDLMQTREEFATVSSRVSRIRRLLQENPPAPSDAMRHRVDNDPLVIGMQQSVIEVRRRLAGSTVAAGADVARLRTEAQDAEEALEQVRRDRLERLMLTELSESTDEQDRLSSELSRQEQDVARLRQLASDRAESALALRALQHRLQELRKRRSEATQALEEIDYAQATGQVGSFEIVQAAREPERITSPRIRYTVPITVTVIVAGWFMLAILRRLA